MESQILLSYQPLFLWFDRRNSLFVCLKIVSALPKLTAALVTEYLVVIGDWLMISLFICKVTVESLRTIEPHLEIYNFLEKQKNIEVHIGRNRCSIESVFVWTDKDTGTRTRMTPLVNGVIQLTKWQSVWQKSPDKCNNWYILANKVWT